MKVIAEKVIKIKAKTYELTKKPSSKNQSSGYIAISNHELAKLTVHDKLRLIVLDEDGDEKVVRTMSYQEVMHRLNTFFPRDFPYKLLKY